MQAVLCDVCERQLQGAAFELHVISGVAVRTETGTRISHRRGAKQVYLCASCGHWLELALDHLRGNYRAVRDAEHLLHPSLRLAD